MAVLLLNRVGELIAELLTELVAAWLADLHTYLLRGVITLLSRNLLACDTSLSVLGLKLPTVVVHRKYAGSVLYNLNAKTLKVQS